LGGGGPSARSKERGRTFPRPAVLLRVREVAMMTRDAYKVPSWAIAILFWRKVLAVESKGIPAIRSPRVTAA